MSHALHTRIGRSLWVTSLTTGVATFALGVIVLLGWYTGNRTLIQVLPAFVPMQYNTALGFVFSGVALLCLLFNRPRPASIAGYLLLLVGGLTLVEYIASVNLGIDELFMKHEITVKTSQPGRMAPNTAICFTLIGLAVAISPRRWSPAHRSLLRVILGSLTFGLAVVALSGYFTKLETAYGWGNLTRMAVHTSVGFMLVSIGLLCIVWKQDLKNVSWLPRWMPVPIFIGIFTAALCFWQALSAESIRIEQQYEHLSSLSNMAAVMLIVGALLALAMATVARFAQKSGLRAREIMQANKALEVARETTLTDLMESAPDAMIIADANGHIRRCNAQLSEIFGYGCDELLGMNVARLIPGQTRDRQGADITRYLEDPQARQTSAGLELFGARKDGTEFPIEVGLSPFSDPEGIMTVAAIRDITKRREAESELRKLNQAVEQGSAIVLITDTKGDIEYVNPRFAEVTGYTAEEAIGHNPRLLNSGSQDASLYQDLWESLQDGREWRGEFCNRKKDGSLYWASAAIAPIRDANGVTTHYVAIQDDITQRKEMESEILIARKQAEAANRAKSEFLSHMSHELRTPLNGVLGYAQILQRDPSATESQKESLLAIENCGAHLLSLINDVLDLSKIEAGKLDVVNEPCDLSKLVKSVADVVGQRAHSKGLSFITEVSPEVPQGIVTDGQKLRQVLVNLLGNAVKFTTEGGVTLRVLESPKGKLRFEIVDTGVGMSEVELADIFDPFKQVEAGKAAGGTGLGLAISLRLAQSLGGGIDVQSEIGKGSTFAVDLPLVETPMQDLVSPETEAAPDYRLAVLAPEQKCTVLVADDRETNRDILERMLRATGIVTLVVDDGDTALEYLREHDEIDLVLMDVRMPRMNGIEAVKEIRSDPDLKDMKVIAVTASVFPEFREKAINAGFDDFLGKPFRTEELIQIIKNNLDVEFVQDDDHPDGAPDSETEAALGSELAARVAGQIREAVKLGNITALNSLASELESEDGAAPCARRIGELTRAIDFTGLELMADELDIQARERPR
jgi:PAS domain S-box-containing protein